MRIEIRSSGGPRCETCGARELVFVPSANAHLEAELLKSFKASAPWYRPVKRSALKHAHRHLEKVCAELREQTIRA